MMDGCRACRRKKLKAKKKFKAKEAAQAANQICSFSGADQDALREVLSDYFYPKGHEEDEETSSEDDSEDGDCQLHSRGYYSNSS